MQACKHRPHFSPARCRPSPGTWHRWRSRCRRPRRAGCAAPPPLPEWRAAGTTCHPQSCCGWNAASDSPTGATPAGPGPPAGQWLQRPPPPLLLPPHPPPPPRPSLGRWRRTRGRGRRGWPHPCHRALPHRGDDWGAGGGSEPALAAGRAPLGAPKQARQQLCPSHCPSGASPAALRWPASSLLPCPACQALTREHSLLWLAQVERDCPHAVLQRVHQIPRQAVGVGAVHTHELCAQVEGTRGQQAGEEAERSSGRRVGRPTGRRGSLDSTPAGCPASQPRQRAHLRMRGCRSTPAAASSCTSGRRPGRWWCSPRRPAAA